jgi:hypothetical protein
MKIYHFLLPALIFMLFACKKHELPTPEESFIEFYYNDTLIHFRNSFASAEHDTLFGRNLYVFKAREGQQEFDIVIPGANLATSYEFNQHNMAINYFAYSDQANVVITNAADTAEINLHIDSINNVVNATFSGFVSEYFSKRPINIKGGKIKNIPLITP